jgi:hypothetical protein
LTAMKNECEKYIESFLFPENKIDKMVEG